VPGAAPLRLPEPLESTPRALQLTVQALASA
jgi:hypothetical protein